MEVYYMDFLFLYKPQKVVFDFNCKYLMMLAEAVKAKVIVARAVYFISHDIPHEVLQPALYRRRCSSTAASKYFILASIKFHTIMDKYNRRMML